MVFDCSAAEALSADVAACFGERLQSLVDECGVDMEREHKRLMEMAAVAMYAAEQERERIRKDSEKLSVSRARLDEAWQRLANERKLHEEQKERLGSQGSVQSGASATWDVASEAPCLSPRVPGVVCAKNGSRHSPPASRESVSRELNVYSSPGQPTCHEDRGVRIESDVRQVIDFVEFSIHGDFTNGYSYAVWPTRPANEPMVGFDMWNKTVQLPQGWEVLEASMDGFEATIAQMTQSRWGAGWLCTLNSQGGFDAHATCRSAADDVAGDLRHDGSVPWLKRVGGANSNEFKFTCGGARLVIRARTVDIGCSAITSHRGGHDKPLATHHAAAVQAAIQAATWSV